MKIDPTLEFAAINDEMDENELDELASTRRSGIANVKMVDNSPTTTSK